MESVSRRAVLRGGVLGAGLLGASLWAGPLDAIVRAPAARADTLPEVTSQQVSAFATESAEGAVRRAVPHVADKPFSMLGFDAPPGAKIRVRTAAGPGGWGDWIDVPARQPDEEPDDDAPEADDRIDGATEPVWVSAADRLQIEVEGAACEDVGAHLIDSMGLDEAGGPGEDAVSAALDRMASAVGIGGAAATAHALSRPDMLFRRDWGANESWRSGSARYASNVRFGVVHHTVTGNGYSQAEAPGVVRGIYRYHTQSRGWSDIGYNFLIDRYGTIYEGRAGGIGRPVIGAHAGGFNSGSVGIALIGTFTSADVPQAARDALARLLAWKFELHGVDPRGTVTITSRGSTRYPSGTTVTKPTIIGHRDVSSTACPGNTAYRHIEGLRNSVEANLGDIADPLARVGGSDGIATAVLLSQLAFPDNASAERAVIATESVFADAAAGGPLAGDGGPILLTPGDALDGRVAEELARVLPDGKTVYLLGGEAALSARVERDLASRWEVVRLAGAERVETAALAAREVVEREGRRAALVARAGPDDAWADGLAAGAYGARHGCPVLLTDSNRLSPAAAQAIRDLGIERCTVVGGPTAVSDAVLGELPEATRVAGSDRAGTAVAVAEQLWGATSAGDRGGGVLLAGGYEANAWKDALTAAPVAAVRDLPVVLSAVGQLPRATEGYLEGLGDGADASYVVGGTAAISDPVSRQAAALLSS